MSVEYTGEIVEKDSTAGEVKVARVADSADVKVIPGDQESETESESREGSEEEPESGTGSDMDPEAENSDLENPESENPEDADPEETEEESESQEPAKELRELWNMWPWGK